MGLTSIPHGPTPRVVKVPKCVVCVVRAVFYRDMQICAVCAQGLR